MAHLMQPGSVLRGLIPCDSLQHLLANKLITAVILSVLISALISVLISSTKNRHLKLPPGPRGVPILGYLPFLSSLPHKKMAELAQTYGPLVYMKLGSIPVVVVSSPKMMKEVLVTQDHIFGSRPQSTTVKRRFQKGRNGCASSELGVDYKHMRRLYTHKLQSPQNVQAFEPVRSDEMKAMVRGLWEDGQGGKPVDLHRAVVAMANNVTTRMVLNKRYYGKDLENAEEARIFERITRVIGLQVGKFYLADYIPSIQPVFTMLSKNEKLLADVAVQADAFIESIFERHQFKQVKSVSPDEYSEETNFIDVLMNLANDGAEYLDQELIKLVILEALLVGTEGMCITAEWAMAELLRHPKILQKLQTELDTIVGTSRLVKESDFPNLPYFQAIMKENFRLHPAGPIMVPHESIEATKIDGYDIPAHTRVFPNVWAMGRDPSVWDRPSEFDPDRFLNLTDVEKQDPKVKVGAFGSGRRQCPGMRAGSLTVGLAVAHLVQCFAWSTPGEVDVTEKFDGAGFAMLKNPLLQVYIQAPRVPVSLFAM